MLSFGAYPGVNHALGAWTGFEQPSNSRFAKQIALTINEESAQVASTRQLHALQAFFHHARRSPGVSLGTCPRDDRDRGWRREHGRAAIWVHGVRQAAALNLDPVAIVP
jgi:hypothetical protein